MAYYLFIAIAFTVGVLASWAMTVPLHRFKEFRPKSPRDLEDEYGAGGTQIVRAAYRQAICPECHHRYSSADVTPVVSWFTGCPGCGVSLPVTVPLLQVGVPLSLVVTVASLMNYLDNVAVVVPFMWLVVILGAISLVDFRIWLIPYWMPWLGTGAGLLLIAGASIAIGKPGAVVHALIGGLAISALFFILWLIAPAKMGLSDVRLSMLIGVFLAWLDPVLPVYGILFGSVLAVLVGLISLAMKKGKGFAYGPSLAMGALSAVWFAEPLLRAGASG